MSSQELPVHTSPSRWEALPRPIGFVFGGGATLGALQVGMLRALADAGIQPDVVTGTSVGALNGAVLADAGDATQAADALLSTWTGLSTADVFPGSAIARAIRTARGLSVFPDAGLRRVIRDVLGPRPTFEALALPFAAVATSVLTGHANAFARGDLVDPLLASAAIPGLLPTVDIDGHPYWDGGVASNIPLLAARELGAASLVVLDPGDICHRDVTPRGAPASTLAAMGTAIRQRVLVEIEPVAAQLPVLYLERPCVTGRAPLSFASTPDLLVRGEEQARRFLAAAPVPTVGRMVGGPHVHTDADGGGPAHDHAAGREPMFPRGRPATSQR